MTRIQQKIREHCKEFYFRNDLLKECENPENISNTDLMEFIQRYELRKEIDSIIYKENEFLKKINDKMDLSLSFNARIVLDILYSESKQSYIVGGSVRDCILGKDTKDFDFVTDIHYDELIKIFTKKGFTVIETGKQFLVLTVILYGEHFEIAMFRKDGVYSDGRRPDSTEIGNIYDDSQRRDFTINALYWNRDGVLDPTGRGLDDARGEVLRFIGNPIDRIKEDYLRCFRFYRFISTKNLIPESKSIKAVRTMFSEAYKNCTPERVRTEIERMI